jgi:hypothetical protein
MNQNILQTKFVYYYSRVMIKKKVSLLLAEE